MSGERCNLKLKRTASARGSGTAPRPVSRGLLCPLWGLRNDFDFEFGLKAATPGEDVRKAANGSEGWPHSRGAADYI